MYLNKSKLKEELSYEVLLLPALTGYCIFFIWPVLSSFYYSFTNWSIFHIKNMHFIGIGNFIDIFGDEEARIGLRNSITYAVMITIVQNILAIFLAVVLVKNLKTKNLLRTVFFAPAVLSVLVVGFLWSFIMSPSDYGMLNNVLHIKINWLGDGRIALFSILLTQVWQWTGWAAVIYIANLQSIAEDFYEAARIDGANGVQVFWRITLPLLVPSVSFNSVMSMIGGLKVFDIIFSLTSGGPGNDTESIVMVLIKRGFTEGQYGYASAYAVIFFVLVFIVSSIQVRFLQKWEDRIS